MKDGVITWEQVNQLFSVVFELDNELCVSKCSATLLRYVPASAVTGRLDELFDIKRPGTIANFEDARANLNSLCLFIAKDESFAIRGQLVEVVESAVCRIWFLGSPWLSWLSTNRPDLKLTLADFGPQDAQMDQLFYMSSEKLMVADLEATNAQLEQAKSELEQSQEERSAFFAQVSHEMRTPLNGVVSALTLLRDSKLDKRSSELLSLAQQSSKNLMQVINYVLDVSKLEQPAGASEAVPFDLPELIGSVVDTVRARAMEKKLSLESNVDGRLGSAYLGDASLLRQSLLNLLINAIKFTDKGSITVAVTPPEHDGTTLRIEIVDTGIGIERADIANIFEPFWTKHSGKHGGTGLGLDIVRRNVQAMDGVAGVSSCPGVGSTFWIELPVEIDESIPGQAQEGGSEGIDLLSGSVLLVDDNETNLMLGKMILETLGVEVSCVASGEAAVERVSDGAPDLVLMDINMPGIDGFEATRRLREQFSAETLPVLALTAYASSVEVEASKKCGMNGYLTKPIERDKLAVALKEWLPVQQKAAEGNTASVHVEEPPSSLLDEQVLDVLASQIGDDNLETVARKFLGEVETRWQAVEGAETDKDLVREVHTLAGACRTFGLATTADKLSCIERHMKLGPGEEEPPCIASVGRELKRGTVQLARYLGDEGQVEAAASLVLYR